MMSPLPLTVFCAFPLLLIQFAICNDQMQLRSGPVKMDIPFADSQSKAGKGGSQGPSASFLSRQQEHARKLMERGTSKGGDNVQTKATRVAPPGVASPKAKPLLTPKRKQRQEIPENPSFGKGNVKADMKLEPPPAFKSEMGKPAFGPASVEDQFIHAQIAVEDQLLTGLSEADFGELDSLQTYKLEMAQSQPAVAESRTGFSEDESIQDQQQQQPHFQPIPTSSELKFEPFRFDLGTPKVLPDTVSRDLDLEEKNRKPMNPIDNPTTINYVHAKAEIPFVFGVGKENIIEKGGNTEKSHPIILREQNGMEKENQRKTLLDWASSNLPVQIERHPELVALLEKIHQTEGKKILQLSKREGISGSVGLKSPKDIKLFREFKEKLQRQIARRFAVLRAIVIEEQGIGFMKLKFHDNWAHKEYDMWKKAIRTELTSKQAANGGRPKIGIGKGLGVGEVGRKLPGRLTALESRASKSKASINDHRMGGIGQGMRKVPDKGLPISASKPSRNDRRTSNLKPESSKVPELRASRLEGKDLSPAQGRVPGKAMANSGIRLMNAKNAITGTKTRTTRQNQSPMTGGWIKRSAADSASDQGLDDAEMDGLVTKFDEDKEVEEEFQRMKSRIDPKFVEDLKKKVAPKDSTKYALFYCFHLGLAQHLIRWAMAEHFDNKNYGEELAREIAISRKVAEKLAEVEERIKQLKEGPISILAGRRVGPKFLESLETHLFVREP